MNYKNLVLLRFPILFFDAILFIKENVYVVAVFYRARSVCRLIYQSKCEFRTNFPSRRDSPLTFPSIWTGKLDERVETRNSSVTAFTPDEFLVQDEFPVSNVDLANPSINSMYQQQGLVRTWYKIISRFY